MHCTFTVYMGVYNPNSPPPRIHRWRPSTDPPVETITSCVLTPGDRGHTTGPSFRTTAVPASCSKPWAGVADGAGCHGHRVRSSTPGYDRARQGTTEHAWVRQMVSFQIPSLFSYACRPGAYEICRTQTTIPCMVYRYLPGMAGCGRLTRVRLNTQGYAGYVTPRLVTSTYRKYWKLSDLLVETT